jgi:hypothetical protein
MRNRNGILAAVVTTIGLSILGAGRAAATDQMQKQAKALGFAINDCLDCHSSPHSKELMEKRAESVGFLLHNCSGCHGTKIPHTLNDRGSWLVSEKKRRNAADFDMVWLKDYVPPSAGTKVSAKPAQKPEKKNP